MITGNREVYQEIESNKQIFHSNDKRVRIRKMNYHMLRVSIILYILLIRYTTIVWFVQKIYNYTLNCIININHFAQFTIELWIVLN